MQEFVDKIQNHSTALKVDLSEGYFFQFFDPEYQFQSIVSINREKHKKTTKHPTEFYLSVVPKPKNPYRILFKTGDDARKDFLVYQSLELIKKVRLKTNNREGLNFII
jgi:hypothetical protein